MTESPLELRVFKGKDGDLWWHVRSRGNGQILAQGEGYRNRQDLEDTVHQLFPNIEVPEPREPEE